MTAGLVAAPTAGSALSQGIPLSAGPQGLPTRGRSSLPARHRAPARWGCGQAAPRPALRAGRSVNASGVASSGTASSRQSAAAAEHRGGGVVSKSSPQHVASQNIESPVGG